MGKIASKHLDRRAYVYVRQSSLAQVQHHQESTQRQYRLQKRALALGWAAEMVEVIDEDQGQSGASSENRMGFQRLVSEVALGKGGAILGLEVSRLARSCADWYRLLEVAALAGTLIVDEEGIYDPNQYNDRLLLGLKGTLSEAELHFLKQRMIGARRHKAQRGEYRIRLPAGYVWEDGIRMDPDERVRDTIILFFTCFERFGKAVAVARYFEDHRQLFPRRDGWGNLQVQVNWGALSISRAVETLRNPIYAGVYVYDRKNAEGVNPEDPFSGGRIWISHSHDGYISLGQHEKNVSRLMENRSFLRGMQGKGSAREGASLLQGIVVCGACGRHMRVSYDAWGNHSYYCRTYETNRPCQWLRGESIDKTVEEAVLDTITGEELHVALRVFEKIAERAQELDNQWQKRIEAARYEADRAARRYYQVDPDNRLVARTLERDWNDKLAQVNSLVGEYQKVRQQLPFTLTDEQRKRILDLAQDIPRLWHEPTTQHSQRKQLVRLLIEDVTLRANDEPWSIQVIIQWKTGVVSNHMAQRTCRSSTSPETLVRMKELSVLRTDQEVAELLSEEGYHSASGRKYTAKMVASIRQRRGLPRLRHTRPEVLARIKELLVSRTDREVAQILNQEGYLSGTGKKFTAQRVAGIRESYGLPKPWWSNAKIAVRIRELVPEHTDEEIAAILNREGYRRSTGKEFTKFIVSGVRSRHGLLRMHRGKDK